MLAGTGPSGIVAHRGVELARWGDVDAPQMLFSATKTLVSAVAGIAHDDGLLVPEEPVRVPPCHEALGGLAEAGITWEHLLQQTSQWEGVLWDRPTGVDAQSRREGDEPVGGPPGLGWAYNDVRVNLLCLALTALLREALGDVLRRRLLDPVGASAGWSWHGYHNAWITVDGRRLPVVSGGAHWGGGLWMSSADLLRVGLLYRGRGRWEGRRLLSDEWIRRSWTPCAVKPGYGYLWWLNHTGDVFPDAPHAGRCARGNLGRHLLWLDPERDLVVVSRWSEDVTALLAAVSAAVDVETS